MLIVHGMAEHCGRWDHVGEFFAAAGYDVHAFDLRGHGVSDGPRLDVAGFDDYVDDLAEIVAEVRDDDLPLVVYGHSMGGLVTVLYAESDHSQADCYVLSAPAIGADVAPPLRIAVSVLGRAIPGIRMGTGLKGEQLARDAAVGEAYFADPLVSVKGTTRFGKALFDAMTRASANLAAIGNADSGDPRWRRPHRAGRRFRPAGGGARAWSAGCGRGYATRSTTSRSRGRSSPSWPPGSTIASRNRRG